jgi:hypothetical protein
MDPKELLHDFSTATGELIDLLSSLKPAELNVVPFEGSWTAGQLGDHLLKSYGVAEILNGKTKSTNRPVDEKIIPVKEAFLNFDIKFKAPDFIVPSDGTIDKQTLLTDLHSKIKPVEDFIKADNDLTLTCLDFELPNSGALTRSEWIQFMTVHTQRHVHQLKKIINALHN